MYRRIFLILLPVILVLFLMNYGCRKKTEEPAQVKTSEQYKAEAEKDINDENMEAEFVNMKYAQSFDFFSELRIYD